ncbi:MAG: LLM class flavin-dependent oxidoreductase [Candidatus Latescibacteria bacterium]|nr:LLM class flavin-dependent oxidoreductase [Candidatus Latescibacterota bacterium]
MAGMASNPRQGVGNDYILHQLMHTNRVLQKSSYKALNPPLTLELASRADALGYDSLWVADHLMLGQDEEILEGWTTLAALAGCTDRARLGLIHQANPMRHPAMAAKMAATLDQLSQGRLIHFFDCGNNGRELQAYGLPWSDQAEERIDRMREALELTLALWSAVQPLDFSGQYYQVSQALCRPGPLQQPHPPVWLGEVGPGIMDLCAARAQGWNSVPVPLDELDRRLALLKAACQQAARPYSELEKSYETQILIAADTDALRQQLAAIKTLDPKAAPDADIDAFIAGDTGSLPPRLTASFLIGTPDQIEAQLRTYIDRDISHFMLWFMDAPNEAGLELFAREVAPRFKD